MQKVIIFDFNRTLYDPTKKELSYNALHILKHISKEFYLILLGKGDIKRRQIIKELNIEKYFKSIYIVKEKNIEQLIDIKNQFPKKTIFYTIGDRIKKEIFLWNQVWFKTIWYKNWDFSIEWPEIKSKEPWRTIKNLEEIISIIE